ncbi:autotransporter-associated N-terminal domain-containing protein [Fusobacterium canifelinum]|uniref:Autotransporter-associated N-terminal domain-containing protein n=1 Tax=Fusobacterium canifelinum TaxID=285729 RepID=A0A7T4FPF3_9FUSO|nr:autotransporter-associated N-terminal domain-containing protein [Fusobacterium canifelinum]QQB74177.1 autotransporter-associated N-terminal domain-containing protein [Fusobacterium canifelinum]
MGSNNLYKVENTLRSIAKRYKSVKYSLGLAILFLMMGVGAFSEEVNTAANGVPTREEIATSRENLRNSVGSLQSKIDEARAENSKSLAGLRLELIQLMEQGDQVVKSPWSSWQFGANYMYSKWNGTYKGRGDKAEKYPFEGIFTRSKDLFLRNISPDSNVYEEYTTAADLLEKFKNPATTSAMKKQRLHYGLEDANTLQEPVLQIELGASVKPKEVVKNPVSVTPPSIQISAVTPLSTPAAPVPPTPPVIAIEEFNPVAPDPITVELPTPPSFNIKLGSYCNGMQACGEGTDGGGYNTYYQGFAKSYSGDVTINTLTDGSPSLRHSWSNTGSVLLKSYFDYTSGGVAALTQNLTVDSVNPLNTAERTSEGAASRPYNTHDFLLGGSRIATIDNVGTGSKLENKAIINLAGPLVIGFEIQSDNLGNGTREISNSGTITDAVEETDTYRGAAGLGGLYVGKTGGQNVTSNSKLLPLSSLTGTLTNVDQTVSRTPDVVDTNGNILTRGGYVGYKIGLILTVEDNDNRANSNYKLINNSGGTIAFKGKSSIGIQVYAPGSNETRVTVQNNGNINMGGIESYGLKLSSRVSDQNMTFENNGTIGISGAGGNSLSSGIAILEDSKLTNTASIRAYKDLVKNKGDINVSGGQGNTGMVLITKANDNITNDTTARITVTGNKNIGMRVDLGAVLTDNDGSPEAINKGTIDIIGGEKNIGMVANKRNGTHKSVAINKNLLRLAQTKGSIGMFSIEGGEIVNEKDIKNDDTPSIGIIGMVINDKSSSGKNSGEIKLSGPKMTGVYNHEGKFEMTDGSISTSGTKSISLYSTGNTSTTEIKKGKIRAEGSALGLFADNKATIQLGDSTNPNNQVSLEADGIGTLLFYNYTNSKGSYTSEGIFKLNSNNVTGNLTNGATAFYFRDTTPGNTAGQTSDKLNAMFSGSGNNKIKLKLDDKSTLFVLDNTNPNLSYIGLSTVDPSVINNFLGSNVEIDSASSQNYKAYKATKASLAIDTDVNLDNHTGAAIDKYYRVDFINSNVKVDAGKTIKGTDSSKLSQAIAQANFNGATSSTSVKVENNGTIDFSKKAGTAIVVDFGEAINNGKIKMDAANGTGENSVALFGASNSKLLNAQGAEIELGTNGVGIWGTNQITSSIATWEKNINIENKGMIKGISTKSGLFGIFADNDKTTYPAATSMISHTGKIDFSLNKGSTGIFMTNGTLNSSGDISVKEGSVGINAGKSIVNITGGRYDIGKESVGFKLSGAGSKFEGTAGNINITDEKSAAYLFEDVTLESGKNFTDNLTLTSNNAYTYISAKDSAINYLNTKTLNNDRSIFMNLNNSQAALKTGTKISSTKEKIVGAYLENGSIIENFGEIELAGDKSAALYAQNGGFVINETTGKIKIGDNGSGIYIKNNTTGTNKGGIEIGTNSVGMRIEGNGSLINDTKGKISSTSVKALGMSQSGGTQNLENRGEVILTGDKSIGMHSEGVTTSHTVLNTGTVSVGDSSSSTSPSIGIYSANGLNSTIVNKGKVITGKNSIAVYGKNIILDLTGATPSETLTGDGGIGVYSSEGKVEIKEGAKLGVGKSLGKNKEGVAVYLAGNNQTLKSETSNISIGDGSFGFVMTGQNNDIITGKSGNTGVVTLGKDSIFLYSADKSGTGRITNYNNLRSTGSENYGLYVSGKAENRGNIDFSNGVGNVGIYSYLKGASAGTTPGLVENFAEIKVSKSDISDPDNKKYGIGMAAGFSEEVPAGSGNKVLRGTGNIKNSGTIKVTTENSIGMYATGKGSVAWNDGRIELSGNKRNIGMFIEEGAEGINTGVITTVGTGNKKQIGMAVMSGGILDNRGKIHIDSENGYGLLLAGAIIKNYGEFDITVGSGATKIKEVQAADTSKTIGDEGLDKIKIKAPAGASEAIISLNGKVQKPEIANIQLKEIANRRPNDIPTSSVGMYIDTSGINYTKPITNIGKLAGLTEADLIVGTEATKYTNSKYIQLSKKMIEPYNDMIRTSGIEKWSIYSGSLTWMATITQLPDFTIRNAYLVKIPYTVFANDKNTTRDTYNFADGLEQRYGVEKLGSRENQLFQKLNSIGNNERILLIQAYDEMMGHQYANVQQRVNATGVILDKEFDYLRDEWRTASKDSNKVKTFGTRGEYKTDTAGVIDYKNNAYGVAYVHEDEDIKLGRGTGWYTGIVHNTFKFKDIGRSKEQMLQVKVGLLKSVPFDDNNSLNWIISGDIFVGRNRMHRKFLVVDEIFNAKSRYYTYGIGVRNEIGKEFRLSEGFTLRPYAALKLEYGRLSKIREKSGEIKLEVKQNQYFSVRPEVGAELGFKHYFGMKALKTTLGVAYENELGRVANGKNKARVVDTTADWFNIRGEKEDRKGNVKVDLNVGLDNTRVGVTANVGYDTKGENLRGGLGLRVIF